MSTLRTNIDGKVYALILTELPDANGNMRPNYYIRGVRQTESGEVFAFLSNRQHKAEARAKARFAAEIKAHMAR